MLNIETARPTAKTLINHIETFEAFCDGKEHLSPQQFRTLNEELSVATVLMIGKRRYQKTTEGKRLYWSTPNGKEHDLGLARDAKIMRDYPGYNARCSISLAGDKEIESVVIPAPRGKGTLMQVTLEDGYSAVAPNYRMAVRNAMLKKHINDKKKNQLSLSAVKSLFSFFL